MSDGSLNRKRASAALVALAITLTGVAWSGCGDDDSATTDEAREGIEQRADEAQQRAEEGVEEAEEGLNEAKEEAQRKIDEAEEQADRYLP